MASKRTASSARSGDSQKVEYIFYCPPNTEDTRNHLLEFDADLSLLEARHYMAEYNLKQVLDAASGDDLSISSSYVDNLRDALTEATTALTDARAAKGVAPSIMHEVPVRVDPDNPEDDRTTTEEVEATDPVPLVAVHESPLIAQANDASKKLAKHERERAEEALAADEQPA